MTRELIMQLVDALAGTYSEGLRLGWHAHPHWSVGMRNTNAAITAAREYLETEPIGERAKLISELRDGPSDYYRAITLRLEAADMLEADAQRITELEALSVTNIMLNVVPGDGSGFEVFAKSTSDVVDLLTKMSEKIEDFELSKQAQQAKPKPLTGSEVDVLWRSVCLTHKYNDVRIAIARAIEAHHEVPPADEPTDWSADD